MLDLATLVAPLGVDRFIEEHWPDTPYSVPDGAERAAALDAIPQLESPARAMEGLNRVYVFRPDGTISTVDSGADALPLLRLGLTCTFSGRHIEPLVAMAQGLCADLSLPEGSLECEVFCSSGDSGARLHSDHDVNFAVLMRGHKRWRVAPNVHIQNQSSVCLPGSVAQPDPIQLELADALPFPDALPPDATTIDLEAGGLLFLPRGWWHETASSGESMQVNFVANRPNWIRVLTGALERMLLRDPRWRAYALDAVAPSPRGDAARAELGALVRELLQPWQDEPDEVIAARLIEMAGLRPVTRDEQD